MRILVFQDFADFGILFLCYNRFRHVDCDVFVISDPVSVIVDGGLSWHNHMILALCYDREKGRKK